MKRLILWMILPLLILALVVNAFAFTKSGTSVAQFLKIGVGARATAMGGAFVAYCNDGTALYWNPAGIALFDRPKLVGAHTEWFADLKHDFVAVTFPLGTQGSVGVSFLTLNCGEMEQTTIEEPEGTGIYFDVSDLAFGLTYARSLTDRFSVGLTAKYIQQNAFNETASTLALDIGTLLETGFRGLKVGMCLSNFGGRMKLDGRDLLVSHDLDPRVVGDPAVDAKLETESWPLPLNFRVGVAFELIGQGLWTSENNRLTVALDGNHPNDAPQTVSSGVEYFWNNILALRMGYKLNHDVENFTFGGGLKFPIQRLLLNVDYAYANLGDLGGVQWMTLALEF